MIGHSVEDHIHQNNEEKIKPGGIYYSILGLSKIILPKDEIHLITALQKDNYSLFSDLYSKINTKDINWVDQIPKVHLFIHDLGERAECYESIPQNLAIDFNILKNFDGININMVSGFDISLEQVREVRSHFNGLIYFDVHTFSRGLDSNNKRSFRPIENFSQWASSLDFIQANEIEVKTLFDFKDESETAKEVLNHGAKYFIVTKGSFGVRAYFKRDDEIESMFVSAEKIQTVNRVGCGDIFGSVFFYVFLKTQNINKSLKVANHIASQSAATDSFSKLKI